MVLTDQEFEQLITDLQALVDQLEVEIDSKIDHLAIMNEVEDQIGPETEFNEPGYELTKHELFMEGYYNDPYDISNDLVDQDYMQSEQFISSNLINMFTIEQLEQWSIEYSKQFNDTRNDEYFCTSLDHNDPSGFVEFVKEKIAELQ